MKKLKLLMPVLLIAWIIFIFCRSLQPVNASEQESQWVLDLFQRFVPFGLSMHIVRKMAHFTEFAILGGLAELSLCGRCQRLRNGLLLALMTGVMTALCDETIQLFVPGRSGQITDVWLDIAGAVAGIALALLGSAVWQKISDAKK